MFQIDLKTKKTIYEQIVDGIKNCIVSGEYRQDERLPSVRELSASLTVNPNTIQKAYSRLEQDGWIYTVAGRGAFVSGKEHSPDPAQLEAIYAQMAELIDRLRFLGEKEDAVFARFLKLLGRDATGMDERRDVR